MKPYHLEIKMCYESFLFSLLATQGWELKMKYARRGTRFDDVMNGSNKVNFLFGLAGNDRINGYGGADWLYGGSGNDSLDGGSGADQLFGGSGNDTLNFTLSENTGARRPFDRYDGGRGGNDTLRLNLTAAEWSSPDIKAVILAFAAALDEAAGKSVNFTFSALRLNVKNFEGLVLYIDGQPFNLSAQVVDLSASTADENVVVTGSSSRVATGSGDDTIVGGPGDDMISSGDGDDLVTLGDGNDVVRTGSGSDTVIAGHGGGDDYINAGPGIDTVAYTSTTLGVNVDLRAQDRSSVLLLTHTALATVGDLLASEGDSPTLGVGLTTGGVLSDGNYEVSVDVLIGVENVIGGLGNDTITGNQDTNRLDGAAGNDIVDGQAGFDAIKGGHGDDTLLGGLNGDTLEGGTGNDFINGGGGYDTLVLAGSLADYTILTLNDGFYSFENTTGNGDGIDIVREVEQITFADATVGLWTIAGRLIITGDNSANVMDGTDARERFLGLDGDDLIDGGLEEDEFVGGRGDDTMFGGGPQDDLNFVWDAVQYDNEYDDAVDAGFAASGVIVDLSTGIAADVYGDTDTLSDIERVYGTRAADRVTGSSADDAFDPNGGSDTIDGGAGWDSLHYHLVDGYYGDGTTSGITVTFSATIAGSGTVIDPLGDIDIFAGIEVVRGTRYADSFTGGLGVQEFRGYQGDDTLDGGSDHDIAVYDDDANYDGFGGILFDLSIKDVNGFSTVRDGFGDSDQVRSMERFEGTGTTDEMRGDSLANDFRGNAGADLMDGAGGNDNLEGGLGNDTIAGGDGDDFLLGEDGQDSLTGETGDDYIVGGADADQFIFLARVRTRSPFIART